MWISIFNHRPLGRVYVRRQRPPLPEVSKEEKNDLIQYLNDNVEKYRIIMKEAPITWKLRNMRSQWGNCRPQQRLITFNLQLARVNHRLRDYIIVHELCHLKVPNHGAAFKEQMSLYMPDWQDRKQEIKL